MKELLDGVVPGERRKWYFLEEVCFVPGVRLTQQEGVYTWKEGIGGRSYEFCA